MLRDLYNETCGVVLRDLHIPMANMHPRSTKNFAFDVNEQLKVWSDWGGIGDLIIYHSHPRGSAFPSRPDLIAARDPRIHYLIYALRFNEEFLYRVDAGEVIREDLIVID